ncbi:PXMP2/4 family protein 4-like [Momordica charantia]|uniref:PXMP2/4 family protein 4-like n=1 Tax=Momordica charantia TaxID=3673 RepID=A0A6J1D7N1_MOMCH|nr:PXMP2/4 family protein 4-like [Momordica charantia]
MMIGALRRSSGFSGLLHFRHFSQLNGSKTFEATAILRKQSQSQPIRPYFRFPDSFRKTKDFGVSPSLLSSSLSLFSSILKVEFLEWYLAMVKCRPVLTKSVTSALIYTAADLSSQTIALSSSEPYDLIRTLRMAGYGMLILGPSLHYWFNFMSKLFPKKDLFSTLKKMAMGQSLYGPSMTVVFFSLNAFLQGENGAEITARLKRDLLPTLLNGVMYWPVCDFITFRFVPVHLQALVSNSFSYVWTVYMTYMASLEKAAS